MEIKGDFFVLLYSESQDVFVSDTLSGMVIKNMDAFTKGRTSDYLVIAMADTAEGLEEKKQKLLKLRALKNEGTL
ncbi:hypothetical protein V2154_02220 [Ewingella sp. CoE-038-23]|uniref:hypothetical protein n=1 Tax=Ewingella docleensis TaxID=3118588 RepID=UPI003365421B